MGLLQQGFKSIALETGVKVIRLLEITWGFSATVYRYSDVPVAYTDGYYQPRVKDWGSLRRSVDLVGCDLEFPEITISLWDGDGALKRIIGTYTNKIRRSTVTIKLVFPESGVNAYSNAHTVFSGLITGWTINGSDDVTFRMRFDDLSLWKQFPSALISSEDYGAADPEIIGISYPLIYGDFDSYQVNGFGFIPLFLVDPTDFVYLVCLGRATQVTRVYVNGVITSSGWSTQYSTRNGKLVTEVKFTADQGANEVTADVQGYETVGGETGGGTLINNPMLQFAHLYSNFLEGDYKNGGWGATSSKLDAVSMADVQSFLDEQWIFGSFAFIGSRDTGSGARKHTGQAQGIQALNSWANSFGIKPFFTNSGKIAFKILDFRP